MLFTKVLKIYLPLQEIIPMAKNENIKISFLGMKLECTNPTIKAIIILLMLLTFFVALVVLLPKFTLVRLLSG